MEKPEQIELANGPNDEELISFEMDECRGCVLIKSKLDVFRINCAEPTIMKFWAAYWHFREFPDLDEAKRRAFRIDFDLFIQTNKDAILELAKRVKGRRVDLLNELLVEIKAELKRNQIRESYQFIDGEN